MDVFEIAKSHLKQQRSVAVSESVCDSRDVNNKRRTGISAVPGRQEVCPDVERLIGELEEAQDAVGG